MENIDSILTLEVKREIAQRYFGFRKAIEEDSHAYMDKVQKLSVQLEEQVGHDLVRIYTLLKGEKLIERFIQLTNLPKRLFVDSHINTQPQKDELFNEQGFRGFTRKGCLQNMFFDAYSRLCRHIDQYRKVFDELVEEQETIHEQINLFYRKNDINSILHFLRGLEGESATNGTIQFNEASQRQFEEKMRIDPPPPANELLPELPKLPESRSVKKQLKELVMQACRQQPDLDPRK